MTVSGQKQCTGQKIDDGLWQKPFPSANTKIIPNNGKQAASKTQNKNLDTPRNLRKQQISCLITSFSEVSKSNNQTKKFYTVTILTAHFLSLSLLDNFATI